MGNRRRAKLVAMVFTALLLGGLFVGGLARAETPAKGAKAPGFTLSTPQGVAVSLQSLLGGGDVVLVVLRGYPGYQCPYCQRQAQDFIAHAREFAAKKAAVLLVYPGPPGELDVRAKEFLATQASLPKNVELVTDPEYVVTDRYGLRWDAPHETAYPSTFILNRAGVVEFEAISHSHGDRTTAAEILSHLPAQ